MPEESRLDEVAELWAKRRERHSQKQAFGKSDDYENSDQYQGGD